MGKSLAMWKIGGKTNFQLNRSGPGVRASAPTDHDEFEMDRAPSPAPKESSDRSAMFVQTTPANSSQLRRSGIVRGTWRFRASPCLARACHFRLAHPVAIRSYRNQFNWIESSPSPRPSPGGKRKTGQSKLLTQLVSFVRGVRDLAFPSPHF
jgi:hypothetical protein